MNKLKASIPYILCCVAGVSLAGVMNEGGLIFFFSILFSGIWYVIDKKWLQKP